MSLGAGKEEPIQPIRRLDQEKNVEEELQRLILQEQKLQSQSEKSPRQLDANSLAKMAHQLPRLIQQTLQKIDANQIYRTFQLPGKDKIVHDNRDQKGAGSRESEKDSIAEEAKKPLTDLALREGNLIEKKPKTYENYLGDVASRFKEPTESKPLRGGDRLEQLFTLFERILLRRFEKGEQIAQWLKEGVLSFLFKTDNQQREFFSRFQARTVWKKVPLDFIQEIRFRGLVQKGSKTTAIFDLTFLNGRTEKFARLRLPAEDGGLAAQLQKMQAGDVVPKENLRRISPGDLSYLAIKYGMGEQIFSEAPQKGKFLQTAQMEETVASHLGITRSRGGKKVGGLLGGALAGEEGEEEQKEKFVPWWQYGDRKKMVKKPFQVFIYFIIFCVGLIALLVLL
ncbi:MAG: hypothetical protein Q7S68_04370 [Deltaproteobacteria bacterium]|nr:hypothetical protein [Deltaproteobacteria bacterium]